MRNFGIVRLIICLAVCFLFLKPAFADVYDEVTPTGLGVSVGTWIQPNFSGIVKAGPQGTEISLNKNLGLTPVTLFVPEVWYRWSHGQIFDVRYTQYNQTVTSTLGVPENYQGINFLAGSQATTNFKAQWADISYELPIMYDTFPPRESYLNAVIDVVAIRGLFTMTDALGNSGTHKPITVPYPLLGLHHRMRLYRDTDLDVKALGMRFGFQDAIGWSYEFEASLTQRIYEGLSITGKYRYFTFYNRDSSDNRIGFRLYGPEVDANYHF